MRHRHVFAHLRPPLLSLLRTIPLLVVRPRIRNFSSCEGTTSGATFLSSVCLFLSSRLSSPRFFLVSFFTWDSPSSAHLPCCFQTHLCRRHIFLCVHHVFSRVSRQASSIQLVFPGSSLSGKCLSAMFPTRLKTSAFLQRPMPLRGNIRAVCAVFGGALLQFDHLHALCVDHLATLLDSFHYC